MKFLLRLPLHPSLPSSSSNLFSEHRQLFTFCHLDLHLTNADAKIVLQGRQALLIPWYGEAEAGLAGDETCSRPWVKLGGQLVGSISLLFHLLVFLQWSIFSQWRETEWSNLHMWKNQDPFVASADSELCCLSLRSSYLLTLWIWAVLKIYTVCRQKATPPYIRVAL